MCRDCGKKYKKSTNQEVVTREPGGKTQEFTVIKKLFEDYLKMDMMRNSMATIMLYGNY